MIRAKQLLAATLLGLAALGVLVACAPTAALNALGESSQSTRIADVAYGSLPRQRLDLYKPVSTPPAGGYPVVLFFYGGAWNRGDKNDYRFVGEALAAQGILTFVADYRLYPEVRYPEFLSDCAQALAHVLDHASPEGGNPHRIFVMGHSAGAYNAAMLALDPRWLARTGHAPHELAGWIGLAGPYDFLPIENPDAQPVFFYPHVPPGTQPIGYARGSAPASLLVAATHDDIVNPERNTLGLSKRLREAGAAVTLKLYEHVNHMTLIGAFGRPLRWLAPVLDDVTRFVNGA